MAKDTQTELELLKLGYEKAAERYDNIYRSIWTIFSYMSAVSAAFLALGGERITPWAMATSAPVPLLFWFWSTYLPLDRYGNQTLQALKDYEAEFAKRGVHVQHYSAFARASHSLAMDAWHRLCHAKGLWAKISAPFRPLARARFMIIVAFIAAHSLFGYAILHWRAAGYTFFKAEEQKVYRVDLVSPTTTPLTGATPNAPRPSSNQAPPATPPKK